MSNTGTSPIGNKIKTTAIAAWALSRKEFAVGPKQHLPNAAGQMGFDVGDECGSLWAGNGGALSQFADQILTGFFDEAQNRPKTQLAAVLGIVALAGAAAPVLTVVSMVIRSGGCKPLVPDPLGSISASFKTDLA
jgi:hypothetical protein